MTCPRCQGLIVREYDDVRCLNCGHRTCYVPPPSALYRPLPERFADLPHRRVTPGTTPAPRAVVAPPVAKRRGRPALPVEIQQEKKRRYLQAYFRRPEVRAKRRAAYQAVSESERERRRCWLREWRQRRKAAMQEATC